jgi:7,8-dihydropterin-6-yl-methyl-4-(beta-D-ribofuranosyl)aminobenzene 5'-phosphate synthase
LLLVIGCTPPFEARAPTKALPPLDPSSMQQQTASSTPLPTETATAMPSPTMVPTKEPIVLTVLYDNYPYDERLRTSWGFSCLVERSGLRVLFDTGGDSPTLLGNMEALGIDAGNLDAIVLSHIHGDHVGGLEGVLARNEETVVYVPQSFPARFKDDVRSRVRLVEVRDPMRIAEGVQTTGELGGAIKEQALIVSSADGALVITGCAHPGIVSMVAKAREVSGEPIELVMGGFHLGGTGLAGIRGIIDEFQRLGVHRVAPTHCSGDLARRLFKETYGDAFVPAGAGFRLEIQP